MLVQPADVVAELAFCLGLELVEERSSRARTVLGIRSGRARRSRGAGTSGVARLTRVARLAGGSRCSWVAVASGVA